jgi:hypothetical protein
VASTQLVIASEVHQLFGTWSGWLLLDDGERIDVPNFIGFAEEHYARW